MSDTKSINVKVSGTADTAKLEAALARAEARAKGLRTELGQAKDQITMMGRASEQLEQFGKKSMGQLATLAAGGLAGGAMYSRVSGGLSAYKQHVIEIDNEARAVKRLGDSYRDYHKAIVDAGRSYGFSNNEVVGLASMFSRTRGRQGAANLTGDMQTAQGFGRAYGMSAMESGGYFNRSVQMGQIGKGGDVADMRQFAALIADSVTAGGMQGRESEVISSIQHLTGAISSKMVTVGGSTVAASALATMNATGIRGMQGEQGSALMERLNSAIMQPGGGQAGDLFMYRALNAGAGKGKGMNLGEYRYLQEEGLGGTTPSGKSSFQALMEATGKTGIEGKYNLMAMGQLTGLSMHQVEAMQKTFMPNGQFQTAKLGALQGVLGEGGMKSVDPSTWGMLSELASGGDVKAIGREFEQLAPGQQAAGGRDELIQQIKQYGQNNVAMSEGQRREKLDNDIAKASEDAGSKLYDLATAADELTKRFIQMGGSLPGPLGGIAPIALGSLGGSAMSAGGQWAFNAAKGLLPGGAPAATAAAEAAGAGLPAAAAGGGMAGMLAGGAQFAGGLGLGAAAAYGGSVIGQTAFGTEAFLGDTHRQAMGQGLQNLGSGNINVGDYARAAGAMAMAPMAVVAGTAYAAGNTIMNAAGLGTGEGFQQSYRTGFFNVDRFDTEGRRQWEGGQGGAESSGGGGGSGGSWGGEQGGGADDQKVAEKTDAILKNTGMAGKGSLLLSLSRKYAVPMELALAQFAKEAQFNTTGVAPRNNNPGNLRFTGNWGDDKKGEGGFAHFPSLDAGIEGYFMLMSNNYAEQISKGVATGDWSDLVNKYAPPTENNSKQYAGQMNAWTQMYHQKIMPSSRGGWFDVGADDTPAMLHKKEMVLPASLADDLRQAIRQPGISNGEARQGGGQLRVKIDPITIQLPGGITTTVNASGSHTPYSGIMDYPVGNTQ